MLTEVERRAMPFAMRPFAALPLSLPLTKVKCAPKSSAVRCHLHLQIHVPSPIRTDERAGSLRTFAVPDDTFRRQS